jgi:hypothetical protein
MIQQLYPWLQKIGATDEATDEALALLPEFEMTAAHIDQALRGATPDPLRDRSFYGSKTVRVRAEHLDGMVKLLKLTGMLIHQGQAGATIWRRGESLSKVSTLDQLADAGR